jgi:hypothetical protein
MASGGGCGLIGCNSRSKNWTGAPGCTVVCRIVRLVRASTSVTRQGADTMQIQLGSPVCGWSVPRSFTVTNVPVHEPSMQTAKSPGLQRMI